MLLMKTRATPFNPEDLSVFQIIHAMKVKHWVGIIGAIAAACSSAFGVGYWAANLEKDPDDVSSAPSIVISPLHWRVEIHHEVDSPERESEWTKVLAKLPEVCLRGEKMEW